MPKNDYESSTGGHNNETGNNSKPCHAVKEIHNLPAILANTRRLVANYAASRKSPSDTFLATSTASLFIAAQPLPKHELTFAGLVNTRKVLLSGIAALNAGALSKPKPESGPKAAPSVSGEAPRGVITLNVPRYTTTHNCSFNEGIEL